MEIFSVCFRSTKTYTKTYKYANICENTNTNQDVMADSIVTFHKSQRGWMMDYIKSKTYEVEGWMGFNCFCGYTAKSLPHSEVSPYKMESKVALSMQE